MIKCGQTSHCGSFLFLPVFVSGLVSHISRPGHLVRAYFKLLPYAFPFSHGHLHLVPFLTSPLPVREAGSASHQAPLPSLYFLFIFSVTVQFPRIPLSLPTSVLMKFWEGFPRELSGCLVVRVLGFHCFGLSSVSAQGTEIPQAARNDWERRECFPVRNLR